MKDAYAADLERFAAYVRHYDPASPPIALKIRHTFQVVKMMEKLCQAARVQEREAYLCFLGALYHDVGRFEQVRRWSTFLDAKSTDHAALSAQICRQEGFLDHLPKEEKEAVLWAIEQHNRLKIDSQKSRLVRDLANRLRDADKLDIFRVFATEDLEVSCNGSLEQAASETISDAVYEAILNHSSVRKADRQTSLDIWATFLGFFFDLNQDEAFFLAREQGYYRLPFDSIQLKNPQTRLRVERMLEEVEKEIERHIQKQPGGASKEAS